MKTKWNFLLVLALLVMLAGGNATSAQAEGTVSVGDIVWVDNYTQEPTTAPIIGQWYTIKAPVMGYVEGMTCGVFFGDGNDTGGTFTTVGDVTWCSAENYYDTAGTYTVEIYVYESPAASTYLAFNSADFYVAEAGLGITALFILDPSFPSMLPTAFVDQELQAYGMITNGFQYQATESCTVDYGDGSGIQTAELASGWPASCQGPVHAYAAPGTYTVTMTVIGFDGTTADVTLPFMVMPQPVLEQLPDLSGGVIADAGFWDSEYCASMPCSGAENFSVPQDTTLTIGQIQLWGAYYSSPNVPPYMDDFTVIIHGNMIREDLSEGPGTPIYTGTHVQFLKAPTGRAYYEDVPEYLITLTLADPPTLPAGKYWLEIYNNGGFGDPANTEIVDYNAFWWESGSPDTLGLGQDGVAAWFEPTQTWFISPPEFNLSLRLFAAEPAPTTHSISGMVFDDLNANGAYDEGEPGLDGLTATLDQGCDGLDFVTSTTAADGSYSFTGLEPGQSYCLWSDKPDGYKVTLYPSMIESLDTDMLEMNIGVTNLPLFSWTPTTPDEGGTATFTGVDGWSTYDWKITLAETNCASAGWGMPDQIGQSVVLTFGASGQYQVCVQFWNAAGWPIYDGQLVTVANVAPVPFDGAASIYPEPSNAGTAILSAEAAFFDVDQLASCTVDYGDGSGPQVGTISAEENACNGPAHTYTTAGTYPVTFTATDTDGASGTVTIDHVVTSPEVPYQTPGFSAPLDLGGVLNTAKAGQMIPLKWLLLNGSGVPVTTLTSSDVTLTVSAYTCPSGMPVDAIETYTTGTSTLQNLGDGYYQLNWKTDKAWANSCKMLTLKIGTWTGDGLTALFQFKR